MFDIMPCPAQSRGTHQTVRKTKAQLFVNGEHTAADEMTRQIIFRLLQEIGVLGDAKLPLAAKSPASRATTRAAEKVEKHICFMASFLRTAEKVERFGILMDRHRWTGTPCGYEAARTVTRALIDGACILQVVRPRKGHCAVYQCSETFRNRLLGLWGLLSFKRVRPHLIEVREPRRDYHGSFRKKRLPLHRFPSHEVRRHQKTVIQLNGHLSCHPLVDRNGKPLDTTLRRIFTGNLRGGGRLYADYQNLPEEDRLQCTIDGEPVCEIDLKASHVAFLAALYQHPTRLPQDPYAAIRWVDTPLLRKAAKTVVQCVIHAEGGCPKRFPRQDDGIPFREKYGLAETRIEDLLPDIFKVMPFLYGSPSLTLPLQFIEAEVLLAVLDRCRLRSIPAFPIHDSLMVKQSDEVEVLRLLQETLRKFLGPHAPWLDVSIAGDAPRLLEPLPCPMDAEYLLQEGLEDVVGSSIEYGYQSEVIDHEDAWDF
ncbi:hypothetical protein [Rhodosalinus sp. FB01]|uniref:hypothetical protein n=1 Tax=Rhodosalinus sp. FB01 TaxID=3239194 RepID=UPI0035269E8C